MSDLIICDSFIHINMSGRSSELDLDAREILRYLNELGIRNVSGEALRDFIMDLKRLIRCDLEQNCDDGREIQGPERLHSASTFSSRLRSRRRDQLSGLARKCPRERGSKDDVTKRDHTVRNVASAPTMRARVELPQRRTCSCTNVETTLKQEPIKNRTMISSSNIIKVPVAHHQKKADPVSLYHYYMSLWEKYKMNLPGENAWAELRWSIRQKLAGEVQKPASKRTAAPTSKELEKRRQGWVD